MLIDLVISYLVTILYRIFPGRSILNLGFPILCLSKTRISEVFSKATKTTSSMAKNITDCGIEAVLTLDGPIVYLKERYGW